MNKEQRKFNKRIKAKKRHKTKIKAREIEMKGFRSHFRTRPVYQQTEKKEGLLAKVIRRTADKMQRRLVP